MKIIGVGLNKTGTKTLGKYLQVLGFRHQTYDLSAFQQYQRGELQELCQYLENFDSCEDWPWPLMYQELAVYFPEARFVLTMRKDAATWYRSLCKMAVRMGPLRDFEQPIYGYSMPHGHQAEFEAYYHQHNEAVKAYFADQPNRLLCLNWGDPDAHEQLLTFLDAPAITLPVIHTNKSEKVYDGDNLWLAHYHRIIFQTRWYTLRWYRRTRHQLGQMAKNALDM